MNKKSLLKQQLKMENNLSIRVKKRILNDKYIYLKNANLFNYVMFFILLMFLFYSMNILKGMHKINKYYLLNF